jgi:hypothetical protein
MTDGRGQEKENIEYPNIEQGPGFATKRLRRGKMSK